MASFLIEHPLLLLALVLAVGSAIGAVKIKKVGVGPAAVLFTALALSAIDARLALPEVIGTFGLAVFTYCVGLIAGPSFFGSLRQGLRPISLVAGILIGLAALTAGIGTLLGLSNGTIAGLFAGATTNTPALAAAVTRLGGSPDPTVGYSLAYLGGVVIMLWAAHQALQVKPVHSEDAEVGVAETVHSSTIRVTRDNALNVRELSYTPYGRVLFSRYRTATGETWMTEGQTVLGPGDLVHAIGPEDALAHVAKQLGERSNERLNLERTEFDYRRMVLSQKRFYGRTVADLHLWGKYGARPTRVRRADQDFLATDDFVLQAGDRIRVAAPRERMAEVAAYLGDSDHGNAELNPLGLFLGLAFGLALGAIPIPMGSLGNLSLGQAAGPLLVGLILGRLGRTGRVVWTLPHTAAETLSQVGMLLFLAYAGGRAGSAFWQALQSELGLKVVAAGLLITGLHAACLLVLGRRMAGLGGPSLAGVVAGAQTQPAVLASANESTSFDQRVALSYAIVYPVAMVVKILLAQILTML